MPNVLDVEPFHALVRKASARIRRPEIAARFEKLAFDQLLASGRYLRPATPDEIFVAPAWVQAAAARGDIVSVVNMGRRMPTWLDLFACGLAAACEVADTNVIAQPERAATATAARAFLAKLDRASFETARRKAATFFAALKAWGEEEREGVLHCPDGVVVARAGRLWRRIRSVKEMRAVGKELNNCLARLFGRNHYGGQLARGVTQFWVLRAPDGAALALAAAMNLAPARIVQVAGPANAAMAPDDPDVAALARALCDEPQPPRPPRRTPRARAPRAKPPQTQSAWLDTPPLAPLDVSIEIGSEIGLICGSRVRRTMSQRKT